MEAGSLLPADLTVPRLAADFLPPPGVCLFPPADLAAEFVLPVEFVLPPAAAPLLEDAPYAAAAVLVPDDCLRDEAAGLIPPAPFAEYSPLSAARPAALVFVFTAVLRTDGFFFMVFLDLFSACDT